VADDRGGTSEEGTHKEKEKEREESKKENQRKRETEPIHETFWAVKTSHVSTFAKSWEEERGGGEGANRKKRPNQNSSGTPGG